MSEIALVTESSWGSALRALLKRGHQPRSCTTLQEGEVTVAEPMDLLVVDQVLSDGSGLELVAQVRAQNGSVPILCMCDGQEADFERAFAAGATDCIGPEATLPVFLAKLEQLLLRAKARPRVAVAPRCGELAFGRYEISRCLGEGAYGAVFAAYDVRESRDVALKVMHGDQGAIPENRARFVREIYTLSAVASPHLPEVYDSGCADGCHYYAMEYVAGPSLGEYIERHGPLDSDALTSLLWALGHCLACLQRADMVHRDIKPGNVVLRGGRIDQPVLVDFGLAKWRLERGLTSANLIMGTPGYLAPECLEGDLDHQSDLFALGVVAYVAATAREPFPEVRGLAVIQRMASIQLKIPLRLPEPLWRIVADLTRIRRDERIATATQLLARLRELPASFVTAGGPL